MMQLFLENSYLKTMDAEVLEVFSEGKNQWRVVLDKTIFYPKGGGQPSDQGVLYGKEWQGKVLQVLSKEGAIFHYVEAEKAPLVGEKVRGEIDWSRRYWNMRLHSAGHVIDFAIHSLGYPLLPIKADHSQKATIWYQGVVDAGFREKLEAKANSLVRENRRFSSQLAEFEELKKKALYLQPNLPTDKPLRMLTLEGVGSVADGGTQVERTQEVGTIRILPIEVKEGITLIRYAIEEHA